MTKYTIDPGCLSKLNVTSSYGLNMRHVDLLIKHNVLRVQGYGIVESSLSNLVEGVHFVVCLECGRKQAAITTRHLRWCSSITLEEYRKSHLGCNTSSSWTDTHRIKTTDQRQAQSKKLKDRFQTSEGEVTRKLISEASRKMQASEYGPRAAQHLRNYNARPDTRAWRASKSKAMWSSSEHREKVDQWHENHRGEVLASASNARKYIKSHFTKPHSMLKEALVAAGFNEFLTEFEVGFYLIDEAHPGLHLAIEVDGCYWHGCPTCGFPGVGDNIHLDKKKTSYLVNHGWTLLRFPEHAIKSNVSACVDKIREVVSQLSKGIP